jgi:hypothetical protein
MSRATTRAGDLWFGVRLAAAGARLRTTLTAVGIGLAFAVLLLAASVPHAIKSEGQRSDARAYGDHLEHDPPRSDRTALVAPTRSSWLGRPVAGTLLQPDGDHPPVPPGLLRVPASGEIVVSPALARLLRTPDAALLRERIGGRIVGEIGAAGLRGPQELYWYGGTTTLTAATGDGLGGTTRIEAFAPPHRYASSIDESTFLSLIVLMGSIALLFPIAILVATAARFGSARRDRRLAALRLLGSCSQRTAWIAAGESLAGAMLGVILGTGLFVVGRLVIARTSLFDFSLYAADLIPNVWLSALITVAVLVVTVGASLLALRRVAIEPLSVVRRSASTTPRKLWWRPLPFVAGFALLSEYLFGAPINVFDHQVRIGVGAALVLSSIAALLPWAIEATVRRIAPWSAASQLAIRGLQHDASGGARIVGGIAVAIAGAVTLQTLLTMDQRSAQRAPGEPPKISASVAATGRGDLGALEQLRSAVRSTRGVQRSSVTASGRLRPTGRRSYAESVLTIGTCADLAAQAAIGACDDASSMYRSLPRVVPAGWPQAIAVPDAGSTAKVLPEGRFEGMMLQIPSTARTVPATASITGAPNTGILTTVGALRAQHGNRPMWQLEASVWLDPHDPLARERLTNAVLRVDPQAWVNDASEINGTDVLSTLKRALLAGAAVLLLLTGASLLVTTLEQLVEQRRTLATLAANGTPRSVLRRALWLRTLIPTAVGVVLAIGVGLALGGWLTAMQHQPVRFDPLGAATVSAMAFVMVAAITGLALPLLRRVSAPSAMRTE